MPLNPDDALANGQYRVLRLLGRGGFGFVYQAEDTILQNEVAIKELIPALVGDETTLKRFLAEARATMRIAHDHIVRTHNVFQEGGNYYTVMECMSGGSLEDRLRENGSLPVDEAVRVATQVCAGLDYAHRRGIVHCDLKPANVLFTSGGAAKVADFGIAHVSEQMLSRSWMTPAGFVAGTLPYMSPEQTDGLRDDPRVDVYALGAVLYRMLTGKTYLDFDQRETPRAQAENVHRICEKRPAPPSTHNRRIPDWLDAVVLKALSKHPDERYCRAAEMQAALQGQGKVAPKPLPVAAKKAERARQRPSVRPLPAGRPAWFWPAVGAVGILLVVLAVALTALFWERTGPAVTPTPEPTQVAVVEATATATATRAPTHTPLPPTSTSTSTDTPRPSPSQTPSSTPTLTQMPLTPTPRPSSTLRPPTQTPKPPTVPASAGRSRIVFVSSRDGGTTELYTMYADGTNLTNLTNHPANDSGPSWSPDGRRVAFTSERDGNREVYLVNADGSGLVNLTNHPGNDLEPSWAPDGRRVAFTSDRGGNRDIYMVNVDGSGLMNLTNHSASDSEPSWAPDGKRIAFLTTRGGGWEIYTASADGSNQKSLSIPQGWNFKFGWSPDSTRIAFSCYCLNRHSIYTIDTGGGSPRELLGQAPWAYGPQWSPGGTRIAFSRYRDSNMDIYTISVNGSDLRRLTTHPATERDPSWSPDGSRIAFSADRDDWGTDIYVMNPDGSELVNLTNSPGVNDGEPIWSP